MQIKMPSSEIPQGQKWIRGNMGRFWDDSFKKFNYTRQPITQEEINDWVSKGYDYVKSFSGQMYDNRNPMPEWVERLKSMLYTYKNMTFTFYKMETLEIMPEHSDHYSTYRKMFNAEYERTHRILIMLEDWKPGHYLEIDGVGIVNWIAGDYFLWRGDCPHAASNIGIEPRYTLQVTAEIIKSDDCWANLHYYNIPGLETKAESKVWMMKRVYDLLPSEHQLKPLYIYMFNGLLKDLENISHTPEETEYLNKEGINFYLTEPLCSYINGLNLNLAVGQTKHDMSFYSEFKGNENPDSFRSDELDSIVSYIQKNNLNNVTVYTCDYDAEKWYPYYNSFMNVRTKDMFVASLTPRQINDTEIEPDFNTKFMCLNWRYTMHRNMLAAYLCNMSSYVSWYFRGDYSVVGKSKWFDIFSLDKDNHELFLKLLAGIVHLNNNVPLNVDLNIQEPVTILNKIHMQYMPNDNIIESVLENDFKIERIYKDIFVDIVTESRFAQPTGNYSEKVYQAIYYKKPFVLAAPPNTLKNLREEGFKTFSDFWDESYDLEDLHSNRLIKIFKVIDYIDTKSIKELREIYKEMQNIVEYNFNLLNEKIPKII